MKNLTSLTVLLLLMCYAVVSTVYAQPTSLPLFQIEDLDYQGAFRIPSGDFGESASDYSTGTIAYNKDNGSLFLSGHVIFGTVGEFSIPALVNSTDLTALNEASVLQNFRQILNETSNGNPQNIDEISGMAYINNRLYVNAVEWYDAPANNTHTTLIIENPSNIQNSAITGYYSLEGAAHTAGWFSPVPPEWQALIGETYLTGNSSKFSINGRLPIGITAFGFNPADIVGAPSGTIATTTLLDYSLSTPLHADYNAYDIPNFNVLTLNGDNSFAGHTVADANIVVGQNNIWTEVSQASFGMIIPGTRTYFTIGSSGGHNSGIGYKPTQSNGNQCGGPCPYDANDYYNYYWLWDTNDLIAVKNGTINPYDVRPYDYGVFNAPFQEDYITQSPEFHSIVGGTFDETNQVMYLSIYDGASTGQFAKVPVIAAYNFGTSSNCPIAGMSCDDGDPNTINDIEDGACGCSGTPLNCPVAGTSCDDGDLIILQTVNC